MPRITKEHYLNAMLGANPEHPVFVELFGPLVGLEAEWRAQGATEAELDLTAFGFDFVDFARPCVCTGFLSPFQPEVLEETEAYRIERDGYGRRVKLCKGTATIPLPIEYPVLDMDDWLRLKPCYAFSEGRFAPGWEEDIRAAHARGETIRVGIPGGFDEPRQLMGEEELCCAFFEEPEMIHDMLQTIADTAVQVLARVTKVVPLDILSVHEDMAGKSGPLMDPDLVREFLVPYYRRCWEVAEASGCRIFEQDSDGDMNPVIDAFLESGLNTMYPFEPAAGMDMVESRAKYGSRLHIRGGIDKHVLRGTEEAIRRELEYKLQPSMQGSGTVFGLDHRIPNGTPIEAYRFYVKTARELLGLDPNPVPGWQRMA